jgi:hypothetical protein
VNDKRRSSPLAEWVFTRIYRWKLWGRGESVSGPGSSLEVTEQLRAELPALLRDHNVRTMLDAPCGDCHWIKEVDLPVERYIGADIVRDLVTRNEETLGSDKHSFLHKNLLTDPLPEVDLILCRDCLIHFSTPDIFVALKNFKSSGARYLLVTSHRGVKKNGPMVTGLWRRVNLEAAPFNFPPPLTTIAEPTPFKKDADKILGLWRIEDILPGGVPDSDEVAAAEA